MAQTRGGAEKNKVQGAEKIKSELVRLANSPFIGNISKQLSAYEERLKRLVADFDHRSRDARERSKRQLDSLAGQLKKTRGEVEKKITTLWNHEGVRLNKGMNELVDYLKSVGKKERAAAPKRKSAGTRKARSKKVAKG